MSKHYEVVINTNRGTIYRQLSKCFFEANGELVQRLVDGSLTQLFKLTIGQIENEEVNQAIALLESDLKGYQGQTISDIVRDLNVEYNRLFVGPGHLLSPPYESIYLTRNEENKEGVVLGESTLDAKKHYLAACVRLPEGFTDLPDHIGVELDFMSYLCFEEAAKWEEANELGVEEYKKKQSDFLIHHLDNWIHEFAESVTLATNKEFYRSLARITEIWIHFDKELLMEQSEEMLLSK